MPSLSIVIALVAASLVCGGCAWDNQYRGQVGFGPGPVRPPPGQPEKLMVGPNGQLIEEPMTSTETVIEGMGQAQRIRELTRKLAR